MDDEDTLNLDDAGFSRTDLPPGGGVGADADQAEEEEEEEVGHLLFCSAVLCPCCYDARGRLAGLRIGLSCVLHMYFILYSLYPETRVSCSRVAFSSPHLICLYHVRACVHLPAGVQNLNILLLRSYTVRRFRHAPRGSRWSMHVNVNVACGAPRRKTVSTSISISKQVEITLHVPMLSISMSHERCVESK